MSALLQGVRAQLWLVLGIDKNRAEIDPEGRPPIVMPEWRFSIMPGNTRKIAGNVQFLHRSMGVDINITKRIGPIPGDRRQYPYIDEVDSLESLSERIIPIIQRYEVLASANTIIAPVTSGVEGFIKPLVYSSSSPPQIVDGSWAHGGDSDKAMFITQTVRFDEAEIVQKLANMLAAIPPVTP